MGISNFSSLIEVATTLSIALVAIEYVKTYTKVLCNQVFKFQDYICSSFRECMQILVDKETLEHIQPTNIEGMSTNNMIERLKRSREKLSNEINREKEKFEKDIELICEAKNISSISLWLFLYGLTALFIIGIEETNIISHSFWIYLTIFTIIYAILGWGLKIKCIKWFSDFSSLRHSILCFTFAAIFSLVVEKFIFQLSLSDFWWNIFLSISVIFMYSNFIAAVIIVWRKAMAVKRGIKESSDKLKTQCEDLQKEVNQLLNVNNIREQLISDVGDSN